jgi:hypothetical protein
MADMDIIPYSSADADIYIMSETFRMNNKPI